jgi:HEAT repeat protein
MRIRARGRVGLTTKVALFVCLFVFSGLASAAPRNKKGAPPVTVDVPVLTEKLKSSDPAEIQAALAQAKAAGKGARPLAPAIEELLRRGAQAEVAGLALQALGEVGTEASAPAMVPYARHRNPDLRKKALAALARTGGTDAAATLRAALSDPDRGVRGVAASGLGPLHAKDAVSDLFTALDHDIGEAAASLGQLCGPAECDRLMEKLSTLGLDVMTGAFDAILFRPAAEVPDETKIHVVERVRDLRTEEANKYLRDVATRWPAGDSGRVRQALDQAIRATQGAKS